jgi:putative heme-binding domain-containing protein
VALATDPATAVPTRVAMLGVLADAGRPACVAPLLRLLGGDEPEAVLLAAVSALQRFDRDDVTAALLRLCARAAGPVRSRATAVLLSRKGSALAFLREVDGGRLAAQQVPVDQLRPVALYHDGQLDALVHKHWGNVTPGTPEEKLAEMRRLGNDLRAGGADPARGREVFRRLCASCHRLFDEGTPVGPDLTHANRKDRDYLLASIVDPSAVIRREYLTYVLTTVDGRVLTGLIAEQTPGGVTLLRAGNERTTVARDRIESLEESPVSLMPENLLKDVKPQELRDLFGFLQQ